jgi:pyruvate dehydrogenase E2 component (dihydrolipoamide acetyltransferase)
MADFTMPALGADMQNGKVIEWRVKPGDVVHPGDVVAVVETHKGAIDVECFLEGVIDNLAPLDTELPVGAVLANVRKPGDVSVTAAPPPATGNAHVAATAGPKVTITSALAGARVKISPAARRKAIELGLATEHLHGSGSEGAVTLTDVALAASAIKPGDRAAAKSGFDPLLMRQAIAAAMGKSKREIPHYYLTSSIDFGAAQTWLSDWNSAREPIDRLLPAVLLLKAAAKALNESPQLNGFYVNGVYSASSAVHLGWAVALRGGGLVAPAIHDANRKSLPELMASLRDLVQRARTGGLRSSELTDPTVTVTSLGDRGAECVLGVIYPPQVAIVGFGKVLPRPWVVDGQVVPRPLVAVSLAADHRVSDGHLGGQFLAAIDTALQNPDSLSTWSPHERL